MSCFHLLKSRLKMLQTKQFMMLEVLLNLWVPGDESSLPQCLFVKLFSLIPSSFGESGTCFIFIQYFVQIGR